MRACKPTDPGTRKKPKGRASSAVVPTDRSDAKTAVEVYRRRTQAARRAEPGPAARSVSGGPCGGALDTVHTALLSSHWEWAFHSYLNS